MSYRSAGVYAFRDRVVFHAERGGGGYTVVTSPCVALGAAATDAEIARALREVIEAFDPSEPPPMPSSARMRPLLRAAGAKSHRELQLEARYVLATDDGERLELTPAHNGGVRGPERGFSPRLERAVQTSLRAGDAEIAAALRAALAACTGP
jgi:hypothetical protein